MRTCTAFDASAHISSGQDGGQASHSPQEAGSMGRGGHVHLTNLREVPAAWPLQTVLDAWVHLNAINWSLSYIQTANAALQHRLELWASQPEAAARCLELEPSEAPREAKLAEALSRYGRAERQRCYVRHFTAQGLVREERAGVVRSHFDARCRELAGRLVAAEAKAGEAKRRRLEESASSASREVEVGEKSMELQVLQEERARLADRLGEAEAEVRAVQDEAAEHREQHRQLKARVLALEAEKAAELQASEERMQCSGSMVSVQTTWVIENAVYKERCEQLKEQLDRTLTKAEADMSAKMEELKALSEEKGKYKERCNQLQQQLAEAQTQALHLSKRSSLHPTFPSHGRAVGEQSSSPESHASDQLGYVLVEDDVASVLSSASWFSVKPQCFMMDSVFKTRSYGIDFFMMGKDLKAGSQVVAGNDQDLLTVAKAPEVCKAKEVVILQAGNATLQVTPDHLVQVPVNKKGPAGSMQYTQAGTLKPGDLVILDSGEPMALTSVESRPVDCEVLKLVFEPDLPIAVFSCPQCILSKCQKKPSIRRGGMSQRGQGVPDQTEDGRVSIPVTTGEYMD